jgi:tight adherence protein C
MTLSVIIGVGLLGAAGALFGRAIAFPRLRVLARVQAISTYGAQSDVHLETGTQKRPSMFARAAGWVGETIAARTQKIDLDRTRGMLLSAGFYRTRPETFVGYQAFAAVVSGLLAFALAAIPLAVVIAVALAACGWIIPQYVVQRKGKFRGEKIEDDLPDLIDLLVVTVEAGLSLSSSLKTASRRTTGPLGDELRLAIQEQRMGLPVADILQNMLHRSDTPSMRSFVRSLVQGETLGVSIGTIMRNLSHEMRARRRARAEERANKAPIKMLFPLIFLIFPSLFIVLLGPAVIEISETFSSL